MEKTFLRRYEIHLNFYDLPNSISKYNPDKFYLKRDPKSRWASENNFLTEKKNVFFKVWHGKLENCYRPLIQNAFISSQFKLIFLLKIINWLGHKLINSDLNHWTDGPNFVIFWPAGNSFSFVGKFNTGS